MNSVDKVKELCKEKKIAISRLEKDLGFSNGYIRGLREGKLPSDRLKAIADYLGVSIGYLLDTDDQISQNLYEELDGVYLSLAREAQQSGIDPDDVRVIIETIKSIKRARGE